MDWLGSYNRTLYPMMWFSHVKLSGPYQTITEHNPCTPCMGGGEIVAGGATIEQELIPGYL